LILAPLSPTDRFVLTYLLLVDWEASLLLIGMFAVVPPLVRVLDNAFRFDPKPLSRPIKTLAVAMVACGLSIFVFWVMVDYLGGVNGPGYTYSNYPILDTIHNWFSPLGIQAGEMGKIGFPAFVVAVAGFGILRLKNGLTRALRETIAYFAAPILVAFELALWYFIPADMYWKVTGFTPWSIGQYISNSQFAADFGTYDFIWGGYIYLLSNWSVLVLSSIACLAGLTKLRSRPTDPSMGAKEYASTPSI